MSQKNDERFVHFKWDPRFRRIQTREKQPKIDSRFQSMFTEEKFQLQYSVDKTGKRVSKSSNDFLQKYYELSSDEDDTEEQGAKVSTRKVSSKNDKSKPIPTEDDELDTSSTDYSSEDENDAFPWGELDQNTVEAETVSRRLAVCNMDWDQVSSKDLFVLLNSFKPPDGVVKSVKIFKSEFGKESLDDDAKNGPKFDRKLKKPFGDTAESFTKRVASEVARDYELRKFKYFYAVVECDSSKTCNKIYEECDGREFECLGLRLDLRFVPDNVEFDEEPVNMTDQLSDLSTYEPTRSYNASVSHFRPTCTWDTGDTERTKALRKAWEKDDQNDLEAYIASSNSEESEEEQQTNESDKSNMIQKYRELIAEIDSKVNKPKDKEVLSISWKPTIDEDKPIKQKKKKEKILKKKKKRSGNVDDTDESEEEQKEELVKPKRKKKKDKSEEVVEDPVIQKKMHAELELLTMDHSNAHLKAMYEGKPFKKHEKDNNESSLDKQKRIDFKFDAEDSRFSAVYNNHLFNLDPSDPRFKKNKGAEALLAQKWEKKKQKK